jgi:DNA-binding beta-propeller fold protein YncE
MVFTAVTVFAQQQKYSLVLESNVAIVTFTNKYPFGVSTLEGRLDRRWVPLENFFTTQLVGQVTLPLAPGFSDYRVRHVSIAPGNAFKNLALVYGDLSTVAGLGAVVPPGTNAWLPEHEGALATTVPLSNPRAVVADFYGHIYVLEKDSHALSVIDGTNGTFHTAIGPIDGPPGFPGVGVRQPGTLALDFGFDYPARQVFLNNPSGLFYRNEKIYVLDAGNGRVLRYTNGLASPTNGLVSVLFTERDGLGMALTITNGGGLWVSADEQEAFYTDGTMLKRWRAAVGVETNPATFVELSAVAKDFQNRTIVTDRAVHAVFRVSNDGIITLEAGTGFPSGPRIGKAVGVSLAGPSSLFYLPVRGYLLGLDQGTSVWQIDSDNNAAKFVFGAPSVHAGDGEWFQKGRSDPKISDVQSVTLAPADGDILMVEGGYVRRIDFLRHKP